jgi:hypothetical protein
MDSAAFAVVIRPGEPQPPKQRLQLYKCPQHGEVNVPDFPLEELKSLAMSAAKKA